MSRKRYELSFDPDQDENYVSLIETLRQQGMSVIDIVRLALDMLKSPQSDSSQDFVTRDELMELMSDFEQRADQKLDELRGELIWQQSIASPPPPDGGNGRDDDPRQAALSAQLKRLKFDDLMQ